MNWELYFAISGTCFFTLSFAIQVAVLLKR